ncbi:hypothetical protein LTR15_012450 [Elasticomyces elasticus]|nr:hypothetical protein LTR15_012450 [Elasticomyces elasticus]
MAPQQPKPTKHSRASRSAKDVRGLYAPPLTEDFGPDSTSTSTSTSTPRTTSTSTPTSRAQSAGDDHPIAPTSLSTAGGVGFEDGFEAFKTNKKDKRTIRHATLLSRVRESGVRKKILKRRRPSKKLGVLGTGLAGLSDALPDTLPPPRKAMDLGAGERGDTVVAEEYEREQWVDEGDEGGEGTGVPVGLRRSKKTGRRIGMARTGTVQGTGKMRLSSVKHKPGAARRKAVMEGLERERMGKNLAGMSSSSVTKEDEGGGLDVGTGVGEKERWAALRNFIGGTMEMI